MYYFFNRLFNSAQFYDLLEKRPFASSSLSTCINSSSTRMEKFEYVHSIACIPQKAASIKLLQKLEAYCELSTVNRVITISFKRSGCSSICFKASKS